MLLGEVAYLGTVLSHMFRTLALSALLVLPGVMPAGTTAPSGPCGEVVAATSNAWLAASTPARATSPVTSLPEPLPTTVPAASSTTVSEADPGTSSSTVDSTTTTTQAPSGGLVGETNDADGWDAITGRLVASGWQQTNADVAELQLRAETVLQAAQVLLTAAEQRVANSRQSRLDAIAGVEAVAAAAVATLGARTTALENATTARRQMAERALVGFVQGGENYGAEWLGSDGNPAVAKTLARAASSSAEQEAVRWVGEVERSGRAIASLACAQQVAEQRLVVAEQELLAADAALVEAERFFNTSNIRFSVMNASAVSGAVFPIDGPVWYGDTWHASRSGGRLHLGVDFIAGWGTPIVATENGVIVRKGWDVLGGWRVSVLGDSGTYYYLAHLAAYVTNQPIGYRVSAGEPLGWVGDTGNATGTPHLHWEVHPFNGEAVNPYPFAFALQRAGNYPAVRTIPLDPTIRPSLPVVETSIWPEVEPSFIIAPTTTPASDVPGSSSSTGVTATTTALTPKG